MPRGFLASLSKQTRASLLIALVFLTLCFLLSYGLPFLMKREIHIAFARQGLKEATYQDFSRRGSEITLSGITLDSAKFSTLETLRTHIRWSGLITGKNLFSDMTIDGLTLTGELDSDGNLSLSGWSSPPLFSLAGVQAVEINGARIDVMTPAGAIRFEGSGRLIPQDDGSRKIEAIVGSKQYQMVLDTRWDGKIDPDGHWTVAADIREARLNLDRFSAARVSGWLSFEGTGKDIPSVSGQIAAGLIKFGDGASDLTDINATLDGKIHGHHIILSGKSGNYPDMTFNADIQTGKDAAVNAAIEGKNADQILDFAQALSRNLQAASDNAAGFTALLLTQGNIKRLKSELSALPHDRLQIVVDGTPFDLTGKIIATKYVNGTPQNNVISINPGH